MKRATDIEGLAPMAEDYRGDDILKLLDRLEDLVDGNRLNFLNRAWGVGLDEFFTLTRKIRASLPDEVRQARRVHSDQERIISDAREEAGRILEDARDQAGLLVSQNEVARLATERAQAIVAQAEQDGARSRAEAELAVREMRRAAEDYARSLRRDADDYAREVLDGLHGFMAKLLRSVEQGRERLEEQQDENAAAAAEEEER